MAKIPAPGSSGGGRGGGVGAPGGLAEPTARELAEKAYDADGIKAGEKFSTNDGSNWTVLESHNDESGFKAIVVENDEGKVVVALAGTDSANDWDDNIIQSAGGIPSQYDKANDLTQRLQQQYGDKLAVTGHSLGGGMANYAAGMNGVPGVGFNSAPLGLGTQLAIARSTSGNTDNFVHYNNQHDIVSRLPGRQLGTVVTHLNNKSPWPGHSHDISKIDPSDPIVARGPLANALYEDYWRRRLSPPKVRRPTKTS